MSPKDRQATFELQDGVDIDRVHYVDGRWPANRRLYRKQRRMVGTEGAAAWVMLALAAGCLIGWALGKLG